MERKKDVEVNVAGAERVTERCSTFLLRIQCRDICLLLKYSIKYWISDNVL